MTIIVRRMKLNEHTDASWDALFDNPQDMPAYCAVNQDSGLIVADSLTRSDANTLALEINEWQTLDYFQAQYEQEHRHALLC